MQVTISKRQHLLSIASSSSQVKNNHKNGKKIQDNHRNKKVSEHPSP
jgi:hypothetical protein